MKQIKFMATVSPTCYLSCGYFQANKYNWLTYIVLVLNYGNPIRNEGHYILVEKQEENFWSVLIRIQ